MTPFRWQTHLQPGEVLLWQGRPYPALRLIRPTQAEWLIGGLGAVVVAALIIIDRATAAPADTATPGGAGAWAMVALLIAALLVTGIPFRQMRRRAGLLKRRNYAVTDRRVLVAADARQPGALTTWPLPRDARPVLEDEGQHLSTLHFGGDSPRLAHLRDAAAIARAIETGRAAEASARTR